MRLRSLKLLSMLLACTLIISACSSVATPPAPSAAAVAEARPTSTTAASSAAPTSTPAPTNTPQATQTTAPTNTPEPTLTPTPAQALDDQWYVDSDGNAVPDFIETELGYDPNAEDCLVSDCPDALDGSDFARIYNSLLILDSSGSMAATLPSGEQKIAAAKDALRWYVAAASGVINLGFMVYGHKGNNTEAGKAESCVGIDVLNPLGQLQRENLDATLAQFEPTGWTPIAAALTKAGEVFTATEDAQNKIILVSDGIETCEGDPVTVAKELHERDLAVVINVIGFDIESNSPDAQQLRQIAEVTGGTYSEASTREELRQYLEDQFQAFEQTWSSLTCNAGVLYKTTVCINTFQSEVLGYLNKARFAPDITPAQTAAYDDISTRMSEYFATLQQQVDQVAEQARKASELQSKLSEQIDAAREQQP